MNATDFIKEHGVEKARELLARLHKLGCPDDMQITVINGMWHRTANGFTYPELKHLVDSVDFINNFGGIDLAKAYDKQLSDHGFDTFFDKAISDYESIHLDNDTTFGELI